MLDRDLQLLTDRVRELERGFGRQQGALNRLRQELDEVTRGDLIAKGVAAKLQEGRLLEREQLSSVWLKLGIAALLVSTASALVAILAQVGVL